MRLPPLEKEQNREGTHHQGDYTRRDRHSTQNGVPGSLPSLTTCPHIPPGRLARLAADAAPHALTTPAGPIRHS